MQVARTTAGRAVAPVKVLHIPYTWFPDPVGGTEVYVASLVRHLAALGVDGAIAAPASGSEAATYSHDGATVHRYVVPAPADLADIYGTRSEAATGALRAIVEVERPQLLNMHAFTRGASAQVAIEARAKGIPVVFTYHTPTVSCQRGTLLRYGRIPCDGEIIVSRCAACLAQLHGAGIASPAIGHVPQAMGALLGRLGINSGMGAAFRLTELMEHRAGAFAALMEASAVVIAPSGWVKDLLIRNGVPPERIRTSRQGTDAAPRPATRRRRAIGGMMRAVMLARLDPAKGLDVIRHALARIPSAAISVDVFGIDQGQRAGLAPDAGSDARLRLLPAVPPSAIGELISRYDVVLVPSQGFETGPLVVLEAFAAGVPVVGSQLGGIMERIRHGVDGLLVPAADIGAWADTLAALAADPGILSTLAAGVLPPRSMREAAEDVHTIYRAALSASVDIPDGVTPGRPA